MWRVPILSPAHFLVPLFVPAAVVLPPFLVLTLRVDRLEERFGPAEVVDPDFFLAASTKALFALMASSSLVGVSYWSELPLSYNQRPRKVSEKRLGDCRQAN